MYKKFFGFVKEPFNITPDSELFYCSQTHEEILNVIEYQIEKRRGFIVLTGEVGTGKTLICRLLLNKSHNYQTSLILNPFLNAQDVLYYICKDFGIISDEKEVNEGKLFHLLTEFLLKTYKEGKNALIIVDEAQNMSFEAFEMIRQISNIELEDTKLVQIIFVGQLELLDRINKKDLRQLRQRISTILEVKPLSFEDTINYVNFRTQESLGYKKFIFSQNALKKIYQYSRGIPREINQIAELSLIAAFNNEHKIITKSDVDEAAKEYYKRDIGYRSKKSILIAVAAMVFIFTGILNFNYIKKNELKLKPSHIKKIKTEKPVTQKLYAKKDNNTDNQSPETKEKVLLVKKIKPADNFSMPVKSENITVAINKKNNLDNISKPDNISNKKIIDNKTSKIVFYKIFLGPVTKSELLKIKKFLIRKKLDYFYRKKNGKYYIYLGLFRKKKNLEKIKRILENTEYKDKIHIILKTKV